MPWLAFDSHKHYTWALVRNETGKRRGTRSELESAGSNQQNCGFRDVPAGHARHSSLVAGPSPITLHSSLSATAWQSARLQGCSRNSSGSRW